MYLGANDISFYTCFCIKNDQFKVQNELSSAPNKADFFVRLFNKLKQ